MKIVSVLVFLILGHFVFNLTTLLSHNKIKMDKLKKKLNSKPDLLELMNDKKPKKQHRKLQSPQEIIDLLKAIRLVWVDEINSAISFNKAIGGKTMVVLPRDAPTLVVNRMPLQGFKLNRENDVNPNQQKNIFYRILEEEPKKILEKKYII